MKRLLLALPLLLLAASTQLGAPILISSSAASTRPYRGATATFAGDSESCLSLHVASLGGSLKAVAVPVPDGASLPAAFYPAMTTWTKPWPAAAWNPGAGKVLAVFARSVVDNGLAIQKVCGVMLESTGAAWNAGAPFVVGSFTPTGAHLQSELAVASDGTDWLVTWTSFMNSADGEISGRIVKGDSTPAAPHLPDPAFIIASRAAVMLHVPAVAHAGGAEYLVVWRDGEDNSIQGRTVSNAGLPGGAARRYSPVGFNVDASILPAVAADLHDHVYIVLACHNLTPWTLQVASNGDVLKSYVAIVLPPGASAYGDGISAAWNPAANQVLGVATLKLAGGSTAVRGFRINGPDGLLIESGIAIADYAAEPVDTTVATASLLQSSIVFVQWTAPGGANTEVTGRSVDLGQNLNVTPTPTPSTTPPPGKVTEEDAGSQGGRQGLACSAGAAGSSAILLLLVAGLARRS